MTASVEHPVLGSGLSRVPLAACGSREAKWLRVTGVTRHPKRQGRGGLTRPEGAERWGPRRSKLCEPRCVSAALSLSPDQAPLVTHSIREETENKSPSEKWPKV